MEEYLSTHGYHVPTASFSVPVEEWGARPTGILNKYTAASILQEVDRAARGRASQDLLPIISEPLIETEAGWVDLELAGGKPVTYERAIERRREIHDLFSVLFDCEVVTLTYGLVEAWFDLKRERFIQEAPSMSLVKAHPDRFAFEVLSHDEVVEMMEQTITTIQSIGVAKNIIITTSPVPMARSFQGKDILIANTYAKSIIRAACGVVADRHERVDYFPSYEIVTLTNDPNIWADDQIHIKSTFFPTIGDQLLSAYSSKKDPTKEAWALVISGSIDAALALIENEQSAEALCLIGLCKGQLDLLTANMERASLPFEAWQKIELLFEKKKAPDRQLVALGCALAQAGGSSDARALLHARRGLVLQRLGRDGSGEISKALTTRRMPPILLHAAQYALIDGCLDKAEALFLATVASLQGQSTNKQRGRAYLGLAEVEARRGQEGKMESHLSLAVLDHAATAQVEDVRKLLTEAAL